MKRLQLLVISLLLAGSLSAQNSETGDFAVAENTPTVKRVDKHEFRAGVGSYFLIADAVLSAGGIWTMQETGYDWEITFVGVEVAENCCRIDHTEKFYNYYDAQSRVVAEIRYMTDVAKRCLVVDVTGSGSVFRDKEYVTEFVIDEDNPLVFKLKAMQSGFASGKMTIAYKDLVTSKERRFAVSLTEDGEYEYN